MQRSVSIRHTHTMVHIDVIAKMKSLYQHNVIFKRFYDLKTICRMHRICFFNMWNIKRYDQRYRKAHPRFVLSLSWPLLEEIRGNNRSILFSCQAHYEQIFHIFPQRISRSDELLYGGVWENRQRMGKDNIFILSVFVNKTER